MTRARVALAPIDRILERQAWGSGEAGVNRQPLCVRAWRRAEV